MNRLPWLTLGIGMISVMLSGYGQAPHIDTLALDRHAPQEFWRWFIAHLSHTDATHLLWNMLAWALLGGALESLNRAMLCWALLIGGVVVNAWFWLISDFMRYAGFSGVLNAVFVVLLFRLFSLQPPANRSSHAPGLGADRWLLLAIYVGAWGKALLELTTGQQFMPAGNWSAAPGAHISGLLAGTLVSIVSYASTLRSTTQARA